MLTVCTIQQFIAKSIESDQIICFGAGKNINLLAKLFANTKVWNKIEYIIDNDKEKQNTRISIEKKVFKIVSPEGIKLKQGEKLSIVITCAKYDNIIEQIASIDILKNADLYSLVYMYDLSREEDALKKFVPANLKLNAESLIPKTIHYCWFGRKTLPDRYKVWIESWHKFCPDYDIIEWNENNYDITKNIYMRQAYENEKWGFVPDYARLDIVYNHGGIYLDTDVEIVQNIDDLLYQKGFAGFESTEFVNLGSGFGAVKGLPIIKKMLDLYDDIRFIKRNGSLNLIASPIWQTQVLKEFGLQTNGEYQRVAGLTIYPEKVLNGKNLFTRRVILKPYTKAIHHFDGSWLDQETKHRIWKKEKRYNKNPLEGV